MKSDQRRSSLLQIMNNLGEQGINCLHCDGHCCSYRSNSMQIAPLETKELLDFLINKDRWNKQLVNELEKCIKDYRLDKEIITGKNTTLRRTYTCPFYTPGAKGCSIDPRYKPYGCLAFNPTADNCSGLICKSDTEQLERRDLLFKDYETHENKKLKDKFQLWWDKLPIPMALLEFSNKKGVN